MSKGVKSKQTEKTSGFMKEIFGMALLLFSVLALLCLITGDVIFYKLGAGVRGFFLGHFGYFSFVLLGSVVLLGLRLLLDRSVLPKKVKRAVVFSCLFIFSVLSIIQTAISFDANLTFSQNFSAANGGYGKDFSTTTLLGGVAYLLIAPITAVSSKVGCYILFAFLGVISALLLFKKQLSDALSVNDKADAKTKTKKEKSAARKKKAQTDFSKSDDFQKQSNEEAEVYQPSAPVYRRPYFMEGMGDFGMKTKKDYNKESKRVDIFEGDFYFKNGEKGKVTPNQTYSKRYRDDLSADANYILTPPPLSLNDIGQSPMKANNPSARRDQVNGAAQGYDESAISSSVYTPFNKQTSNERPQRTGGYEAETRGGLFDNFDKDSINRTPSRGAEYPKREAYPQDVTERLAVERGKRKEPSAEPSDAVSDFKNQTFGDAVIGPDMPNQSKVYNPSNPSFGTLRSDEALKRTNVPDMTGRSKEVERDAQPLFGRMEEFNRSAASAAPTRNSDAFETPTAQPSRKAEDEAPKRPSSRNLSGDRVAVNTAEASQPAAATGGFKSSTMSAISSLGEPSDPNEGYASIEDMPINYRYKKPSVDLLENIYVDEAKVLEERSRLRDLAELVETNFSKRGVSVRLENIVYGMTITRFEYSIPTETSVKVFTQNQGDLAVWLHAKGDIRILAPIPGTSKIGIEVPNNVSTKVGLKELVCSPQFKHMKKDGIYIPAGKNVMAEPVFLNLTDMPHLLVAGATGTGKSVFLNAMLTSLLYTYSPEELRIVIVDPKQLEFVNFEGIPHLLFNKIITQAEEAAALLSYLVKEMENRYTLFANTRVKKISQYNERIDSRTTKKLPYIIVLIDEFADLMMQNPMAKKDMDQSITRLAQLARAAGISLVFATQRPTTDVIDGTIKNNFPARICFKTADYTNSQVVIGENGAEKLLGKGDLLYKTNGPTERAQGALVEDAEILRVVSYVTQNNDSYYDKNLLEYINKMAKTYGQSQSTEKEGQISMDLGESGNPADMPVVYRKAVRLIITQNTTSKSMLQTKLGIGYNKAARIIDWMESQGFVSCVLDNKQREIRIDRATYEQVFNEPFNEDYTK